MYDPNASQAAEGMFEGLHQFLASPEDLLISRHLNGHDVDGLVALHQVLKGKRGETTWGLVDLVTVDDVKVDELNLVSSTDLLLHLRPLLTWKS